MCVPCCVLLKNVSSRNAAMVFLYRLVAEMTFSVTFGASLFGTQFGNFCDRSEYVTICIISATIMREVTVCVTFGAPRSGFPLVSCRRPILAHMANLAHGEHFGQRANVFLCVFVAGAKFWRQRMPRHKRRREHHCLALRFFPCWISICLVALPCLRSCVRIVGRPLRDVRASANVGIAIRLLCLARLWAPRLNCFALWFRQWFGLSFYGVFFSESLSVFTTGGLGRVGCPSQST